VLAVLILVAVVVRVTMAQPQFFLVFLQQVAAAVVVLVMLLAEQVAQVAVVAILAVQVVLVILLLFLLLRETLAVRQEVVVMRQVAVALVLLAE
jgi:hypothetical protein